MLRSLPAAFAICIALFTAPSAQAKSAEDARSYVHNVASDAIRIIETDEDKAVKQKKLERVFSESVDLAWVAKFVMGRYWRQATEEQKKDYLSEYESFILHHYTSRFTQYTKGSFEITGVKDDGDNEYTVSMALKDGANKNSEPVYVDYRVRSEGNKFRIFDVIVEGVSMISTQRSEFASVISRHNIDYLITQLKNKSIPAPK